MHVSRGNILKTIGMLCNPNFNTSNSLVFQSEPYYDHFLSHTKEHQVKPYIFPLPTCIFT